MSVRDGVSLALARLRRTGTLTALLLAFTFEAGVALLERSHGRIGAVDRSLSGGAFGIALPLFAYFSVTRSCASQNLQDAVFAFSRHGRDRRLLALGLLLPPALACLAFGLVSGPLVVVLTRGVSDPHWLHDGLTSGWIGALSGAAYAAALLGASAFGKRGSGRFWLLAADFMLGAGSSFWALPWPKGHVRNLLGGAPVLDLSQAAALGLLFGTSLAFFGLGMLRTQR